MKYIFFYYLIFAFITFFINSECDKKNMFVCVVHVRVLRVREYTIYTAIFKLSPLNDYPTRKTNITSVKSQKIHEISIYRTITICFLIK